jgi:1-acyl-sn-glycerol-3-phosphate acyltransferase
VRRDSGDSAQEIERVRRLAQGLGPGDGVLIYPEGSRFSESRRDRVRTRLRAEGSSRLVLANALENLLPPRRGGVLALLDGAPDAQVLVCTHHGFEGTMSLADLTSGRLIGRRIDVEFRTIPRGEIPLDRDARAQWLDERWLRVDAWLQQRVHGELP